MCQCHPNHEPDVLRLTSSMDLTLSRAESAMAALRLISHDIAELPDHAHRGKVEQTCDATLYLHLHLQEHLQQLRKELDAMSAANKAARAT